jgi:hypothetical protein
VIITSTPENRRRHLLGLSAAGQRFKFVTRSLPWFIFRMTFFRFRAHATSHVPTHV